VPLFGSVEGYKEFVKDSTSTYDENYLRILTLASAGVETYCGRTFAQASYTEYVSGTGHPELLCRHRPVVTSGLTVYLDSAGYWGQGSGAFASTTALTAGSDYALRIDEPEASRSKSGILVWLGGSAESSGWPSWRSTGLLTPGIVQSGWPVGQGNIKLVYTAGFADIPDQVELATYILAQGLVAATDNNSFQDVGESLGPYRLEKAQLQYYARELIGFKDALVRYREVSW
jgi:hypothetical protein